MSKTKVEINYEGVGEILRSPGLEAFLASEASRRAASCGSGYTSGTYMAGTRVIASVKAATDRAARDNSKNNTLLKAVSS